MQRHKKNQLQKRIFISLLLIILSAVFICSAWAGPPPWKLKGPPPAGKVWCLYKGEWIAVLPPPAHGPYVWNGTVWVMDPTPPPPDSEWTPGHWTDDGWIEGHWEPVPKHSPKDVWVPGHWKNGKWVSGHWKDTPPPGKAWAPGHFNPNGRWVPGHWK
jgi:hypothetical protein